MDRILELRFKCDWRSSKCLVIPTEISTWSLNWKQVSKSKTLIYIWLFPRFLKPGFGQYLWILLCLQNIVRMFVIGFPLDSGSRFWLRMGHRKGFTHNSYMYVILALPYAKNIEKEDKKCTGEYCSSEDNSKTKYWEQLAMICSFSIDKI